MTQQNIILLKDIFYVESRNGDIYCSYLNERGVLQQRNLGTAPFSNLAQSFPWTYMEGEKGFLINFDNVEKFSGIVVNKGQLEIPFEAAKGEVLNGAYGVVSLPDFPGRFPGFGIAKGGTAVTFREVTLQGHDLPHRIVLLTPAGSDVLDVLKERQKNTTPPPGILFKYTPRPESTDKLVC